MVQGFVVRVTAWGRGRDIRIRYRRSLTRQRVKEITARVSPKFEPRPESESDPTLGGELQRMTTERGRVEKQLGQTSEELERLSGELKETTRQAQILIVALIIMASSNCNLSLNRRRARASARL